MALLLLSLADCTSQDKANGIDDANGGAQAGSGGDEGGNSTGGAAGNEGGVGGNSNAGGSTANAGASGNAQGGANTGGNSNAGGSANTGGSNAGGAPNTGGNSNAGGSALMASVCKAPACDDFESYNKGNRPAGPWTSFDVTSGSLAVDDTRAFSGTKSVKVTLNPSSNLKARMNRNGPPGDEAYLRMMIYLNSKITGKGVFHWNFMMVEGGGTYVVSGGGGSGDTFQHFAGGGRDCFTHGDMPVPVGKWTCVEFHLNGKTDLAETYYNGVLDEFTQIVGGDPVPGSGGCLSPPADNWNIPPPNTLHFGFTMFHELDASATMWMDDAVVSDKRIGCPKMQ